MSDWTSEYRAQQDAQRSSRRRAPIKQPAAQPDHPMDQQDKATPSLARPQLRWRCVADVAPQPIDWLWPGFIPLGKLTLFAGDPGLGKSFVTCDLASRVSRGAGWPDQPDEQQAGSVVFLACEDDVADTIRPRLDRASADVKKIHIIDAVSIGERDRSFALDLDVPLLRDLLERIGDVRVLIIDPISAYCGDTDSHKNSEVRAMLAPLVALAAEFRVAVVAINHLTKGIGGKAVYRSMGSIAFAAAARAVFNFYRDPDDEKRRLMLPTKLNLAPDPYGLSYKIEDGAVRWGSEPVWKRADDIQTRELDSRSGEQLSARQEAKQFIQDRLADGPIESKTIIGDAKEHGIALKTLRRAYKDMGGKPEKSDLKGPWMWSLPTHQDGHF